MEGPGRRGAGPARAGGRSRPRLHRRGRGGPRREHPYRVPLCLGGARVRRAPRRSAHPRRSFPARRGPEPPGSGTAGRTSRGHHRRGALPIGAVLPRQPGVEVLRHRSHLRERRLVGPAGLRGDPVREAVVEPRGRVPEDRCSRVRRRHRARAVRAGSGAARPHPRSGRLQRRPDAPARHLAGARRRGAGAARPERRRRPPPPHGRPVGRPRGIGGGAPSFVARTGGAKHRQRPHHVGRRARPGPWSRPHRSGDACGAARGEPRQGSARRRAGVLRAPGHEVVRGRPHLRERARLGVPELRRDPLRARMVGPRGGGPEGRGRRLRRRHRARARGRGAARERRAIQAPGLRRPSRGSRSPRRACSSTPTSSSPRCWAAAWPISSAGRSQDFVPPEDREHRAAAAWRAAPRSPTSTSVRRAGRRPCSRSRSAPRSLPVRRPHRAGQRRPRRLRAHARRRSGSGSSRSTSGRRPSSGARPSTPSTSASCSPTPRAASSA